MGGEFQKIHGVGDSLRTTHPPGKTLQERPCPPPLQKTLFTVPSTEGYNFQVIPL